MIYYILLLYILVLTGICFGKNLNFNKNKAFFLTFTLAFMIFMMGTRSLKVGVDTHHYQEIYNIISKIKMGEVLSSFYTCGIEIGYAFLMKLCSYVGNYYFFQVLTAVILHILIAMFLYNNVNNLYIGILIYLGIGMFGYSFNITRQMIATMMVVNCYTLLNKNKKIESIFLLVVATLIHTLSIIFLAGYLIYFFRNNKYLIRIIPILGILIAKNYKKIIELFSGYFPKYINYFVNNRDIQEAGLVKILWFIFALLAIWIVYKGKTKDRVIGIFVFIYVLSNVVGLYFNYFERIGLFFCPFTIILIDISIKYIKSKHIRWLYSMGISICFSVYFIISMTKGQYIYSHFWE